MWIVEKTPNTMTSKELQADLEQSGVVVPACTIRRTLYQVGLTGPRPRRTPLLKERDKKARLMFTKL